MIYKRVILKRGKEESLKRFHPWVFSGAIARMDKVEEGDLVTVYDHEGNLIGNGHFQIGSIAVRILSFDDTEIDANFFLRRLSEAFKMRQVKETKWQSAFCRTSNPAIWPELSKHLITSWVKMESA